MPVLPEELLEKVIKLGLEPRRNDSGSYEFIHQDGSVLKPRWSPCLLEDLKIFKGIDATKELTDILIESLEIELDVKNGMSREEAIEKKNEEYKKKGLS